MAHLPGEESSSSLRHLQDNWRLGIASSLECLGLLARRGQSGLRGRRAATTVEEDVTFWET